MLGAIIGDIVGSRFEFNNHRSKEFDLFADGCFATDDSIMSLAVAKAIMETFKLKTTNNREYDQDFHNKLSDLTIKYMQEIGRKYPSCGFGGMFYQWVFSDSPEPYNSFGNGAAMRISAAGFVATNEMEVMQLAETVTAVTHDHEEGIKGAEATAVAIYLARKGATKREIREKISRNYYPLNFKIDDIRATYRFNETCQETVPQAIECFLESMSFEDAIRTAISLGGDSDTIGAITGAIAEAYYGVPEEIKGKALAYLDDELRAIYDEWVSFIQPCDEQFRVLTKYIGKLSPKLSIVSDYTHEPQYEMLFHDFYDEFMHFIKVSYPQYCEDGVFYTSILRDKDFSEAEVAKGNVDDLDALTILAIIHRELISGSHWNYNEIASFKEVKFVKWLKRLKDIDWQKNQRCITEVKLELGGMGGYNTYCVTITDTTASFTLGVPNYGDIDASIDERKKVSDIRKALENIHFEYWLPSYPQEGEMLVCDGEQWSLIAKYDDGTTLDISGDNTYPENWSALLEFFGIDYDEDEDSPKRQPGEVIYCSVSFDGGKTYYYTTEDESIEIGDEVIVPVGADGNDLTGVVEDIEYFQPEDVPFPLDRTKTIIRKAYEFRDDEDNVMEHQINEKQFIVLKDSSNIDVLDESLYCYDSTVFTLTPAIQSRTSDSLIRKIKQFINSVPAAQKANDYLQSRTEYIPRLDMIQEEVKHALQNGTAEMIPCKNSTDAFFLQIRSTVKGLVINGKEYGKHRKIKDIPLGTRNIPVDVAGAMQCLSMQSQLNQISNGLKEISETCERNFGRIIQGQRDDRLAKLFSSRSCFIQALAMSDESLQSQMLTQAIRDANSARAELAFQIKSDISLLGGEKPLKSKDMGDMVRDINIAIVAMNNAVQISLYSYQVLGERNAQLAVVKEHETFVKQVLLKEIETKDGKNLAWELIQSSGKSGSTPCSFRQLPLKLLNSSTAFIKGTDKESINYLEDKFNGKGES